MPVSNPVEWSPETSLRALCGPVYCVYLTDPDDPEWFFCYRPPWPLPACVARTIDGRAYYFDEWGRMQLVERPAAQWLWEEVGGQLQAQEVAAEEPTGLVQALALDGQQPPPGQGQRPKEAAR